MSVRQRARMPPKSRSLVRQPDAEWRSGGTQGTRHSGHRSVVERTSLPGRVPVSSPRSKIGVPATIVAS
jgi:hypothetical protein